MHKVHDLAITILRLAFLAFCFPIPALLSAQNVSGAELTAPSATATTQAEEPAAKRKIGVAMPVSDFSSDSNGTSAAALQLVQAQLLTSNTMEAVLLKSSSREELQAEAAAEKCDLYLLLSLSQKAQAQGRFARFAGMKSVQLALTAAQFIPVVSGPAMLMTMAGAQVAAAPLAQLTQSVKPGTDLVLHYDLLGRDKHVLAAGDAKAHKKAEEDDALIPLIRSVVAAVTKSVAAR